MRIKRIVCIIVGIAVTISVLAYFLMQWANHCGYPSAIRRPSRTTSQEISIHGNFSLFHRETIESSTVNQPRHQIQISDENLIVSGELLFANTSGVNISCSTIWEMSLDIPQQLKVHVFPIGFTSGEKDQNDVSTFENTLQFATELTSGNSRQIGSFLYNSDYIVYFNFNSILVLDRSNMSIQEIRDTDASSKALLDDFLLIVKSRRTIDFWDLRDMKHLRSINVAETLGVGLSLSNDLSLLVSGLLVGNSTYIWDVETGDLLSTYPIQSIQTIVSEDNKVLFTRNWRNVSAWNIENTNQIFAINSDTENLTSIALDAENNILAIGKQTGSLNLYDSLTGELLITIQKSNNPIRDIEFSSDGQMMIVATEGDGSVEVWEIVFQ